MKIGPLLRKMMTPRLERWAAGLYRSIFVDLAKVAECLAMHLPTGSRVLDIGGGDGELVNKLLDLRPDLQVDMVDVAESVGRFIDARHIDKVAVFPRTRLEDHLSRDPVPYGSALISDVMHHLPGEYRGAFLNSVALSLQPCGLIFVKDVEPIGFISFLSFLCDKFVSGDHGVSLISQVEVESLAASRLSPHVVIEAGLYARDFPNYLLVLSPSLTWRPTQH